MKESEEKERSMCPDRGMKMKRYNRDVDGKAEKSKTKILKLT